MLMIPAIPPDKRRGNKRGRNSALVLKELAIRKAKIKNKNKERKLSAGSKGCPQKEISGQREKTEENKKERKIKRREI